MKKRAREITQYSGLALSAVLVVLGLLFIILVVIVTMHNDRVDAEGRQLSDLSVEIGHRLRTVVIDRLDGARVVAHRMEDKGGGDFEEMASVLAGMHGVRVVSYAPGCRVSRRYPESGDVDGVGTDLSVGRGGEETLVAARQNRPTLAGPFYDENGDGGYLLGRVSSWDKFGRPGVVGVVMSFPGVLDRAFLHGLSANGYSVRVFDAGTGEGVWSSEGEPSREVSRERIRLYNFDWVVEVSRRRDLLDEVRGWLYLVGLGLVGLLVGVLGYHYHNLYSIKSFMEGLAMTDGLTGLPNRRATLNALSRMVEECRGRGEPFVLLYMDLNGFKQVNDTYGHDKGDLVLTRTAEVLRMNAGELGVIGRVGGDEFVFLFEGMTEGGCLDRVISDLGERLVMSVSGRGDETGLVVTVSASFGVAYFPGDGVDAESLLRVADLRMYETKKRLKGSQRVGPYKPSFRDGEEVEVG